MVNNEEDLPEQFVYTIRRQKSLMPSNLQTAAEKTECFGVLFKDQLGVCPEEQCVLRVYCETAYTSAVEMINKSELPPTSKVFVPASTVGVSVPAPSQDTKKRGKYKGQEKYKRKPYRHTGKPVDAFLLDLIEKLDYPLLRARTRDVVRGLMQRVERPSYSLFYIQDSVIRFWVNAIYIALVDVTVDLVPKLVNAGFQVSDVPIKWQKKLAPCTHRLYVRSLDDVRKLADVLFPQ